MISNAPEQRDANFSYDILIQLHNKKLVGEYGNFINRNLAFLVKKFDRVIPDGFVNESIKKHIEITYKVVGSLIEKGKLKSAIAKIQDLVQFANKYYDDNKPWISVKENIYDFYIVTFTCLELIINIANLYEPFIPESSKKVFSFFGKTSCSWEYISIEPLSLLKDVSILFDRI